MQETQPYVLALAQLSASNDLQANLEKTLGWIERAAREDASVVCLQELFNMPYPCQAEEHKYFDWAEPIPGPSTEAVARVAKEHRLTVIVPLFEKRAPGLYHNSIAVIGPQGDLLGVYRKMHIPDDPGFYEKYYFAPGDLGFKVFHSGPASVGTLICWDQWYPEAARLTAMQGANLLVYPTAIGWHPQEKESEGAKQRDAWRTIQRGHAVANGVFVAAANRVGHEKPNDDAAGVMFWGSSFICGPFGEILAEGSEDREELILAEIDPAKIETVRRNWPFLRDRRIDAYSPIDRRFLT
ncbi:MAG: acyltransferase [bacterium]|nr:acyltransferase [bacterium]